MTPDFLSLWAKFRPQRQLRIQLADFKAVFRSGPAQRTVIPELMEFCGVGRQLPKSTEEVQRAAGRLDVWNFLQQRLQFTEDELYRMVKGETAMRQPNA